MLGPRAKTEEAGPNAPPRRYWEGPSPNPGLSGRSRRRPSRPWPMPDPAPTTPILAGATAWLLAHRIGTGWLPHKADGPALAALSAFYGSAGSRRGPLSSDRHGQRPAGLPEGDCRRCRGRGDRRAPRRRSSSTAENRIRFDIEGRGTFGYAVTLTGFTRDFGPEQDRRQPPGRHHPPGLPGRRARVRGPSRCPAASASPSGRRPSTTRSRRSRWAAGPGSSSAVSRPYQVGQAGLGAGLPGRRGPPAGRRHARRGLGAVHRQPSHAGRRRADPLLPARPVSPGQITYEVFGYLPGDYRALPPEVRSAYDPGRRHLGQSATSSPRRPARNRPTRTGPPPTSCTPAARPCSRPAVWPRPPSPLQHALGRLHPARRRRPRRRPHAAAGQHRGVRAAADRPVLRVPAGEVPRPGRPVRQDPGRRPGLSRHRRVSSGRTSSGGGSPRPATWRTPGSASCSASADRPLEAVALLLDLWREYPNTESIESDFFGLSQFLASLADAGRGRRRRPLASLPRRTGPARSCSSSRSG